MGIRGYLCDLLQDLSVVRQISELIQSYRRKSPLQKWISFVRLGSFILKSTGSDILNPYYKVTLTTGICGVLAVDYVIVVINSYWYYKSNMFAAIRSIGLLGLIAPVISLHKVKSILCKNIFQVHFYL